MLTSAAILYTWHQLAERAGISTSRNDQTGFEELGIEVFYGRPEDAHLTTPGLIIRRCADASWEDLRSMPDNSLEWKSVEDILPLGAQAAFKNKIPVILWGSEYDKGVFAEQMPDGSIVFNADILAASLFMLSRWEEIAGSVKDEHERFPAAESVAYRQGFLEIPIVDQYALILQAWLHLLLPSWQPAQRLFSVKLSHDIDHVRSFNSAGQILKTFAYEALKKRNMQSALEVVRAALWEYTRPQEHQDYRGILKLAALSKQNDMESAFYFKASKPGAYDSGYKPEWRWVKDLIRSLHEQGFEIGFHPGYETLNDLPSLRKEKKRLDHVARVETRGGRQHYLRFQVPQTWRYWDEAGMVYDSTMGYSQYAGFRCGTCHPYHPFDLVNDHQLGILEIPLIVMDGTLMVYRSMSIDNGEKKILELAARCHEVGGVFTLLWHNTSLKDPGWAAMYERVIFKLNAMQKNLSG
jgi:hypothetical protein